MSAPNKPHGPREKPVLVLLGPNDSHASRVFTGLLGQLDRRQRARFAAICLIGLHLFDDIRVMADMAELFEGVEKAAIVNILELVTAITAGDDIGILRFGIAVDGGDHHVINVIMNGFRSVLGASS